MVDWDNLLIYETLKIVRIHDKRLGVLYYSLVFLIICYVIGFQILYSNEHFQRYDVHGMGRITIQQPTYKLCNPNDADCLSDYKPLTELPYCKQYTGKNPSKHQQDCIYADQHSLMPRGMLEDKMFVPTRIDKHYETKACEPSPDNGWVCMNEYTAAHASANSTENVYVADIERYTLLFTHVYHRGATRGNSLSTPGRYRYCDTPPATGNNLEDDAGEVMEDASVFLNGRSECAGEWKYKDIDCVNDKCLFVDGSSGKTSRSCRDEQKLFLQSWAEEKLAKPSVRRESPPLFLQEGLRHASGFWTGGKAAAKEPARSSEERSDDVAAEVAEEAPAEDRPPPGQSAAADLFNGAIAIPPGDIFAVKDLLTIAGLKLDGGKDSYNMDCEPFREAGMLLEVEAAYENLQPFASSWRLLTGRKQNIAYTYNVRVRPVGEMKTEQFASMQPLDFPNTRLIENRHGLYIVLKVSGQFGEFNLVYLLVMLTTSLALLAAATKIVDLLAIHVLADRETYRDAKYDDRTVDADQSQPLRVGL